MLVKVLLLLLEGLIFLKHQTNAKPWTYPLGFVSDFHGDIEPEETSASGHSHYTPIQSRSGLTQPSEADISNKLLSDKNNALQIISGLFNSVKTGATKKEQSTSSKSHQSSVKPVRPKRLTYLPPPQENPLKQMRDNIKSIIASTFSGTEQSLLNGKDIITIFTQKIPGTDIDFRKLLRKRRTQLMELLKKENLIGLMEEVGQLYGERGTLNIPYNLRRLASKYQGNFKYATKRLKNFKTNISGILDGLKNPETPSAFSAPIYLTRDPFPVTNLLPLDAESPLSARDQIMLQYATVIVGGALVLAL